MDRNKWSQLCWLTNAVIVSSLLVVSVVLFPGCGGGSSGSDPTTTISNTTTSVSTPSVSSTSTSITSLSSTSISSSSTTPSLSTTSTTWGGGNANIDGYVADVLTNFGIVGASITFEGQAATAGADGLFSFTGLPPGAITVTITASGYRSSVETVVLSAGGNTLNVSLVPTSLDPNQLSGPAAFVAIPMSLDSIGVVYPLGMMSPPNHVLPTNHIYLSFQNTQETYNVYFPASGEITRIYGGVDYKVEVRCSNSFLYYLGHIQSLEAVYAPYIGNNMIFGVPVFAGQLCGTTGQNNLNVHAMDLGVIDTQQHRSFITEANYLSESLNCGAPLDYYSGALRTSLISKVERVGTSEANGKIDYDQAGKLIGNWFHISLSAQPKEDYSAKEIAFVYYARNATWEVISIGGEITGEGVGLGLYVISPEATHFADVNSSSGIVNYVLHDVFNPSITAGDLIVRYNADGTISVEASSNYLTDFSAAAKTYSR
ncbi:hypothetical protein A2311_00145 [candidate division WOR-1 bacterium RIFOXYB2_FULL_48_7]|uniref:Carboxypeptidase regulatory-like domain-containing protein n=1 Tax=candidate division WOR-1 bacterium RIFOXYB2_FULL_48_7 TaxID=1802583 RepID=A0A1F4TJ63_UNCSA|nr:MAG: hypothetical protein A2311_00145 [candidate division WOR-1 bacterium RIFOXYB2_FULL_48_7]